jgi:A-factor type gamma-butyrolactone 1'-reductase (1S-forming)
METDIYQRLTGKIALITGASSGIGAATARLFAREGATVVLAARNEEKLTIILEEIKRNGGKGSAIRTDVSDAASIESLIKQILDLYGQLDIAFNNAGASGIFKPLIDVTEEEFDRMLAVNLKGIFLCMKYQIPAMVSGGGGAILNMSSVMGIVGKTRISPYIASKHGVIGLTKAAAIEYAKSNIRVNAIAPGTIQTERFEGLLAGDASIAERMASYIPMGRLGSMSEVAETALWICSDSSSYLTGITIPVDGGYIIE